MYFIELYCFVLHSTDICCIALNCTVVYSFYLHCIPLVAFSGNYHVGNSLKGSWYLALDLRLGLGLGLGLSYL